uniref:VWFA domain-containing protein n=1 Tax=Pinctada fucata TaxID=50426 RepID=A0A194APR9_PINFU
MAVQAQVDNDNNILLPAAQKWTLSEAQKAKDAGIFVFAIGIGSAVNLTELNIMASEPKSNFMIHVPSFQQLNTQALKNLVAYRACEVNDKPTPPPTPPPTLAPTTAGNQQEQPDCTGMVADVIFLVDESGSLGSQKNFNKEIGFVRNVIRDMDIGPKKTQVGLIVFADTPRTILQLNDTRTNDEIQKALKSVNWGQGNTFTDRALQKMMQEGFTKSSGARDGVPRIGVVITDGNSTYPHFTEVRADEAKAKNIHLFAIGIGTPYINELITIASKKENVYKVDDLTALDGIKRQFSKNICTKPQQDQPKDVCPGKQADVVIVSDASTSIGQMDFNKQLNFISDVVDKFDIGPDNVRVAMVTFSTNAKLEFSFTSFTDKKNLKEAILKRAWTTGLTFTDKALGVMIEEMKKARQNVPKICIVITDGWSRRPLETEKQAAAAKAKNIKMFSIGVGPYIVPDELDKIASDPSMSFMVEDYSALGKIQNSVAARTCSSGKPKDLFPVLS